MLWGKGDSSKLTEEERLTLGQLRRMVETGHIVALNADQTDLLVRALERYSDWESTFRTLKHVRNVLTLLGFFFGAWWLSGGNPVQALVEMLK